MAQMNMDVGSSFAAEHGNGGDGEEEEEYAVDEHGEDLIEQPVEPVGRTVNYNADEDRLLCRAWFAVAMDPVVGTDQPRGTYWARMKEYFYECNTSGNERSDRSLRSWWSVINTDCQKWPGALAGVDALNPSGTAQDDRVSCSLGDSMSCSCAYVYSCK